MNFNIYLFYFLFSLSICNTTAYNQSLIPYRVGDKWGLADEKGTLKIQPQFNDIADVFLTYDSITYYEIENNNSHYLINNQGKEVVPKNSFEDVKVNNDGDFIVIKNSKYGLYKQGKLLIQCEYDDLYRLRNESYKVKQDDLYGLINKKGKLIIPVSYQNIWYIDSFSSDKKNIYWEAKGLFVTDYFEDKYIQEGDGSDVPAVGVAYDYNYDKANEKIKKLETKYLNATYDPNSNGNGAFVKNYNGTGYYDLSNEKELVPPIYQSLKSIRINNKNYFIVRKQEQFGIIDIDQNIVLPLAYDSIKIKNGQSIILYKNGLLGLGFIDGSAFPPPQYDSLIDYTDLLINAINKTFFIVNYKGKKSWIDDDGVQYFKDE